MGWIILGIIFFVITVWSLKGAVITKYFDKNRVDEYHGTMWVLLIACFIYCFPILNILVFVLYNVWFFLCVCRKPGYYGTYFIISLSQKNILHKILDATIRFLTKEL